MSTNELSVIAADEMATERLGVALGAVLERGMVVALCGNLGAGKTRFSQAVSVALGVARDEVRSPTFLLIQEYHGRVPVYHFDTYRLRDLDEFEELGAAELLEGDGVCLVEWADRVTESLPEDRLQVVIEMTGETERTFSIRAFGKRSENCLQRLRNAIN